MIFKTITSTLPWIMTFFSGTNAGYTNGGRISYTATEEHAPKWAQNFSSYLPLLNKDGKKLIKLA